MRKLQRQPRSRGQPFERRDLGAKMTRVDPMPLRQQLQVFMRMIQLLGVGDQRDPVSGGGAQGREFPEESRALDREQRARGMYRDENAGMVAPRGDVGHRTEELP